MAVASLCVLALALALVAGLQRCAVAAAGTPTNGTSARVTMFVSKAGCDGTVLASASVLTSESFVGAPCNVVYRLPSTTVFAYHVICYGTSASSQWTVAMRRFSCTTTTCACSGTYYYAAGTGLQCMAFPQPWDNAYTVDCSNAAAGGGGGSGGGLPPSSTGSAASPAAAPPRAPLVAALALLLGAARALL
jgi:hypothetical protein